jgi:CAAX protease family protein
MRDAAGGANPSCGRWLTASTQVSPDTSVDRMVFTPFTMSLWAVFLVFAAVAVVSRIRGRVRFGLGVRHPAPWRAIATAVVIGAVAIGSVFLVEFVRGSLNVASVHFAPKTLGSALELLVPWAVFEEVILRCPLVVGVLVLTRRPWVALLASATMFGLAHAPNDSATWLSILSAGLGGAMYALAYVRTGRVWLPLALHLTWNLSQAVLGFPVSGVTDYSATLISQTDSGAWWITGGAYGPEGGLVGIGARLVVIALLILATRRTGPAGLADAVPLTRAVPPVSTPRAA